MKLRTLLSRFRSWLDGGSVFELQVGPEPEPAFPPGLSAAQRDALSRFADLVGPSSREFQDQLAEELRHARGGLDPCPRCSVCGCSYMPKPRGIVDVGLCKRCASDLAAGGGQAYGGPSCGR